jgi:hypothetical protein
LNAGWYTSRKYALAAAMSVMPANASSLGNRPGLPH